MKKIISLFSLLAFMTAAIGTSVADSRTKTAPKAVTASAYSVEATKVVQFGGETPDQANAVVAIAVAFAVIAVSFAVVDVASGPKQPAPKTLSLRPADGNSDVLFDVAR